MAEETKNSSGSGRALIALIVVVAICTVPGVVATFTSAVLGIEYRRVRSSRWTAWSLVSLIIAVIAAGGTATWMAWSTSFAARTWAGGLVAGHDHEILAWAAEHTTTTWGFVIGTQAGFGIPVGLALAAAYSVFRARARRLEGAVEGAHYSNMRPVGWMDKLHEKRVRARIAAGDYLQPLSVDAREELP